jgi:hypothetical protein
MKERHGSLVLDAADCAIRWMSDGREQTPPMVKFFSEDSRRAGYWNPRTPNVIWSKRGMSAEQVVKTVFHEVSHFRRPWDRNEGMAELEEKLFSRRHFESSQWDARRSA